MKPSGAHTHPGSGGGLVLIAAVIAAAVVAVPVIAAVTHLLEVVVIVLGAVLSVALLGGLAFAVYRARHPAPIPAWLAQRYRAPHLPPAARPVQPLSAPRRAAIDRPGEVHLHFHGVTAEDVAAVLGEVNRRHD